MCVPQVAALEVTPLIPAWPNVAHPFYMNGGIRVRFFYPRYSFGLRIRYDAWPSSVGFRDVVAIVRSLLDEVFLFHKHLQRLFENLSVPAPDFEAGR